MSGKGPGNAPDLMKEKNPTIPQVDSGFVRNVHSLTLTGVISAKNAPNLNPPSLLHHQVADETSFQVLKIGSVTSVVT